MGICRDYGSPERLKVAYSTTTVDDINPASPLLRTLNYGIYALSLIMGTAGFISSNAKRAQRSALDDLIRASSAVRLQEDVPPSIRFRVCGFMGLWIYGVQMPRNFAQRQRSAESMGELRI